MYLVTYPCTVGIPDSTRISYRFVLVYLRIDKSYSFEVFNVFKGVTFQCVSAR